MLDIKDKLEEDKFFYFLEGLTFWARTKLKRHCVQDLANAQTAQESLIDYATKNTQPKKAQSIANVSIVNSKKQWKSGQSKNGKVENNLFQSNPPLKSGGTSIPRTIVMLVVE